MRPVSLLLLLLLAACDTGNSPQAQCERQAMDDPAVREIYRTSNGDYTYADRDRPQLLAAKRDATMRCLRAKGLAPPGGVQTVQPHL
jgi:hypothetical protein